MSLSDEERKSIVEIWSKVVDTQMHFNEMCVKSRQLGLTFVAGALGVGIVLLGRGGDFSIPVFSVDVHVSVLIVLAAAAALYAVRILDLNVYHKMLRGAVSFGEDFEENYMKQIFQLEKGMTQAISHFSRFSDAKVEASATRYKYVGSCKVSAEEKIRAFYRNTVIILILAALLLFVFTSDTLHTLLGETMSASGGR